MEENDTVGSAVRIYSNCKLIQPFRPAVATRTVLSVYHERKRELDQVNFLVFYYN